MKIIILAAMDKEMRLLTGLLENNNEETIGHIPVNRGRIGIHDVIVAKCGIGKVNAALNTLTLIRNEAPELILNSGVAGGAGIPVGTVLVADKVAYDDVWCGPGTSYGEADGCPLFFSPSAAVINLARKLFSVNEAEYGLICSGDKFISSAEEIAFIRSHFPDVKAVDMESAAIAQTCFLNSVPFNIIRVVSDTPGEGENLSQYENFWEEAPAKTFHAVEKIIKNL